jgi:hypothetical protein
LVNYEKKDGEEHEKSREEDGRGLKGTGED